MPWFPMTWGRMSYSAAGDSAVPLVLLHGSGCDSADWDAVVRALPGDVGTVRLDFRGHGRSDVPNEPFTIEDLAGDVVALVDHLAVRQVVLVGHSLGGMVAMSAAARSSRVAGLVLFEGWTSLQASEAFTGERFYGRLDRPSIEAIRQKSVQTQERFAPTVWNGLWASIRAFDGLPYLRTATIPVLEVYGEMGKTDSTLDLLMIPDNPAIRVLWIPDAGHYVPHEQPEEVARVCREAAAWNRPAD